MEQSSPFVSSCTRRQWAKRRGRSRLPRTLLGIVTPFAMTIATTLVLVAIGAAAFLAGHGSL